MFRTSNAKPFLLVEPAKPNEVNTALLKKLLTHYPDEQFFDVTDNISQEPVVYSVPAATSESGHEDLQLNMFLVRYPRKKNPHEYRYAVCRQLTSGGEGVIYKSDGTLLKERAGDGSYKIIYKPKTKPEKERIVKQFMPHLDSEGYSCYEYRKECDMAESEAFFLGSMHRSGLKSPIINTDGRRAALIMHCIQGEPLSTLYKDNLHAGIDFNTDQLLKLTILIAEAIAKVHAAGIIHRDLNPRNILVTLDNYNNPISVDVIDFGLAKKQGTITMHEDVGTIEYAPPETDSNIPQDEKSDVYTFAHNLVKLWRMGSEDSPCLHLDADDQVEFVRIVMQAKEKSQDARPTLAEMLKAFNTIVANRRKVKLDEAKELINHPARRAEENDSDAKKERNSRCIIC